MKRSLDEHIADLEKRLRDNGPVALLVHEPGWVVLVNNLRELRTRCHEKLERAVVETDESRKARSLALGISELLRITDRIGRGQESDLAELQALKGQEVAEEAAKGPRGKPW